MPKVVELIVVAQLIAGASLSAPRAYGASDEHFQNDYPTTAIADFVFGCMKANGETRQALEKCSCSIDVISTLLTYDRYEEAEAFLSLGQMSGERGVIFRTSEQANSAVGDLRRAQVEAELRCF